DLRVSGAATTDIHADEDLGALAPLLAVVELGDVARAEHAAELKEAALLLGDLHRQQHLAAGAQVGTLGDVAQAVEVDVGATVDRYHALAVPVLARDELLHAGHTQRTGRLGHGARIF